MTEARYPCVEEGPSDGVHCYNLSWDSFGGGGDPDVFVFVGVIMAVFRMSPVLTEI